ncbi:MAG: hypothetical protein HPZ79_03245 [Oscillospiraceae bacterium]|nr:hypothetical protein [Oscillospiraceae bacterium]
MIVFVSALSVPSFAYSRTNAVNYANTYALSCNPNHKYFTRGGNCTNFVSQCMYAGGVKTDSTWNFTQGVVSTYNTYTRAWTVADELKNYIKINLGGERLVSKWKKYGDSSQGVYGYVNNSNNLTNTGIEIVFYDWQDDGIIDHSSIIVGTGNSLDGTGYGDLVDQNSTDRKQTLWHLDSYNSNKKTTAIYAFRLC